MITNSTSTNNYQIPDTKYQIQNTGHLHPSTPLPTETIIELAKYEGVDFGTGDPGERIRYFIKLGLLPNAVRKTPHIGYMLKSFTPDLAPTPTGHLPFSAVEKLVKIDRLNKRGLTFPQIAQKYKHQEYQNKLDKEITAALPTQKPKKVLHHTKNVLLFSPIACLLVLVAVTISLKAFPEASNHLLQIQDTKYKIQDTRILGAKAPQNPVSNTAAAILRPFTNLAQVILYGPN